MTEAQRELALALSPNKVNYFPGSSMKRFAGDMAAIASNPGSTKKITPGQHSYLVKLAIKFKRQLPQSIVLLAERLARELEAA